MDEIIKKESFQEIQL